MTAPAPPVPVVDDPLVWCVADAIADCLCAQLPEVSAPVACCCVMPGELVAWDDCTNGQAWVRVASVFQVGDRFPLPAGPEDITPCGGSGGWAATLELGVIRCMPGPDEQGYLPDCDEYRHTSRLVLADGHAMRRAVLCCDWRDACNIPNNRYTVGSWTPLGPQGVCVGGTLSVTVELSGCICDRAVTA